jgi:hypothetical protein
MAPTTIQVNTYQCLGVDTKTNDTLSEAGLVIELQAGGCFALISTAITLIVIEIQGTLADTGLTVFNETGCCSLLGDCRQRYSQRQCGLLHVPLLSFLIFVFLWSWV